MERVALPHTASPLGVMIWVFKAAKSCPSITTRLDRSTRESRLIRSSASWIRVHAKSWVGSTSGTRDTLPSCGRARDAKTSSTNKECADRPLVIAPYTFRFVHEGGFWRPASMKAPLGEPMPDAAPNLRIVETTICGCRKANPPSYSEPAQAPPPKYL